MLFPSAEEMLGILPPKISSMEFCLVLLIVAQERPSIHTITSWTQPLHSLALAQQAPTLTTREIAAFFANIAHETSRLCYVEQIEKSDYCDSTNKKYQCVAGKQYYGRGPLQLTWNYNYDAAGHYLGFDGLNHPEIVAQNGSISWKTAVWFWMKHSNCHSAITSGQGFRATIKAISGDECNGGDSDSVDERVNYYTNYCNEFGVDPGSNLSC
uniref:Class VII chitinase n=1 Tax=Pinus banksiana TaxID=3353 RepID=A0A5C0ZUL8_PINBN|nr:class VII chitinase [Pinus banksiana]